MFAFVFLTANAWGQQDSLAWQQELREKVRLHELDAALATVEHRLQQNPSDLEARGWRGRLLAWKGQWAAAESEYRRVLSQAPQDTEIFCGLSDVLLWQGKLEESLSAITHAREVAPGNPEILLRRARILRAMHNTPEARRQYHELLIVSPHNQDATRDLSALAIEDKHELRIGSDVSTFSYSDPAEDELVSLTSRWTRRFTSSFTVGSYQRFGQHATDFTGSATFRVTAGDWLTAGGAVSNHQNIVPGNEALFEYGHGFRFSERWVKGLEASYQQHWLWYHGAHVLTLSATQLYYLPNNWTWSISLTAARSGFAGTGVEWVPSGYSRLGFPLHRTLSGDLTYANGTENFAQIDQIGHFSARTFLAGLKYRFAKNQDIRGYAGVQKRTGGKTQNSFGVSYGFHF